MENTLNLKFELYMYVYKQIFFFPEQNKYIC